MLKRIGYFASAFVIALGLLAHPKPPSNFAPLEKQITQTTSDSRLVMDAPSTPEALPTPVSGLKSNELSSLLKVKDKDGKDAIKDIHYAKYFLETQDNLQDLEEAVRNGATQRAIGIAIMAGQNVENLWNFHDSSKPNNLTIFGYSDHNGATGGDDQRGKEHYHQSIFALLRYLKRDYDIKLEVALTEKDVYALENLAELLQPEILTIVGHGNKKMLRLYTPNMMPDLEQYKLDTEDKEPEGLLNCVPEGGIILLYSCSTAQGGENADNLANHFARLAPGRRVIAPTIELNRSWTFKIDPLEIELGFIDSQRKYTKATYSTIIPGTP